MNPATAKPDPPTDAPATSAPNREPAAMSRAAKAQLVIDLLNLKKPGLPDAAGPADARRGPATDARLVREILSELVSEVKSRPPKPKDRQTPKPAIPRPDHNPATSAVPPPPPARVGDFATDITREHPVVAATILSAHPTDRVVAVLRKLPPDRAQKIALALCANESGRKPVPARAIRIIAAQSGAA